MECDSCKNRWHTYYPKYQMSHLPVIQTLSVDRLLLRWYCQQQVSSKWHLAPNEQCYWHYNLQWKDCLLMNRNKNLIYEYRTPLPHMNYWSDEQGITQFSIFSFFLMDNNRTVAKNRPVFLRIDEVKGEKNCCFVNGYLLLLCMCTFDHFL
jgi:hypothetical protein